MDDRPDTPDEILDNSDNLPLVHSIAWYSMSVEDALATIRVTGPAKQSGLNLIQGVTNGVTDPECVRQADLALLQRDFSTDIQTYEQILALAHSLQKPVVFDIDDLLLELPEDHPDRLNNHFVESLLPILRAVMDADLITVPTRTLRDYFLPYNKAIEIIPNYLNDALWKFNSPAIAEVNAEKITIGYMGGHSHAPDLQLILPASMALLEKYAGKIRFHFWGIQPPEELRPYSLMDWYPPNYQSYQDFVHYFQTQTADILIAPLCDTLFNACKSSIKYLEYAAMGVPGVFSHVTPYTDIVQNETDGFLASTTEEWVNALSELIENPRLRSRIAHNAQEKVKKSWLLSQNADKQREIYSNLVRRDKPVERHPSNFYPLLKSLSNQIQDGFSHKKLQKAELEKGLQNRDEIIATLEMQVTEDRETIASMTDHLAESTTENSKLKTELSEAQFEVSELHSELTERETEIITYVTSRSWQFTRPFRRLSRLINRRNNATDLD